jgi:uncharacterized protein YpuA (DUF1002 family)
MINKKKIIIISLVVVLGLVGISTAVYFYQNTAEPTVKRAITAEGSEVEEYLTDSFLEEINDAPTNREYLDSGVSDYEVRKSVRSVSTEELSSTTTKAIVIVRVTTKNHRTGFEVITEDTYEAMMVKDGLGWKINSYELINSETMG